jgi:hypothetical protein
MRKNPMPVEGQRVHRIYLALPAAEKMFEATGQQEFDFPVAVQVGIFHSLVTWPGQSPFNSAQSVKLRRLPISSEFRRCIHQTAQSVFQL